MVAKVPAGNMSRVKMNPPATRIRKGPADSILRVPLSMWCNFASEDPYEVRTLVHPPSLVI